MMPVVFAGHGNPMYAIQENGFTREWQRLGSAIAKPKAILVISAHWETQGSQITSMAKPRTIHDFYGFPPELFAVQYGAGGDPRLAGELMDALSAAPDQTWGLDHGTWSVLKHMFPAADVPVLQLSLDRNKSPREHLEFARRLQDFREQGVLIIGSGNIVHNLRLADLRNKAASDWATDANETIKRLFTEGETQKLADYEQLGDAVRLAIPTAEHFLPLLYVATLKTADDKVEIFNDVVEYQALSMTSWCLGG